MLGAFWILQLIAVAECLSINHTPATRRSNVVIVENPFSLSVQPHVSAAQLAAKNHIGNLHSINSLLANRLNRHLLLIQHCCRSWEG